ncbi:MAG: hypothetical protein AN484_27055 [Aphanizomenon flos-aquae WA102]|uniref:Uncharacterized protein n=1 Tax=Aphanizomenon flos-aquae WA102 TaxID=1710896 RepID=A0A1B7W9F8_APHFL|nr:MAG: hypothetical protein AN484_27055 [Aphanizomenon flos-aquae WA102]
MKIHHASTSVVDPHSKNADPDPAFYLNADPDPDADPDPALKLTYFQKSSNFLENLFYICLKKDKSIEQNKQYSCFLSFSSKTVLVFHFFYHDFI